VAVAGVLVSVTVAASLAQQRNREKLYSTNVAHHATAVAWPDPRRQALGKIRRPWHPLEWKTWALWIVTIGVFAFADVAAVCTTDYR
jgi:hypothetical protein